MLRLGTPSVACGRLVNGGELVDLRREPAGAIDAAPTVATDPSPLGFQG